MSAVIGNSDGGDKIVDDVVEHQIERWSYFDLAVDITMGWINM